MNALWEKVWIENFICNCPFAISTSMTFKPSILIKKFAEISDNDHFKSIYQRSL